MSIQLLELAAESLGELREDVVFVGAATVTLWITDPGAPPVRPTRDVDVVAEVTIRDRVPSVRSPPARATFLP